MIRHGTSPGAGELRFDLVLGGSPERVWRYLTSAEERARWLAGGDFELEPGGAGELVFDNRTLSRPGDNPPPKYADVDAEVRYPVTVMEAVPPSRLVIQWPFADGTPSLVSMELNPADSKTRLTLSQTGLTDRSNLLGAAAGWHTHLEILRATLEGQEAPSFWSRHTELEAEYDARLR